MNEASRVRVPLIVESEFSIPERRISLILGRIVMLHVRDEAVLDAGRLHIDAASMDLIGRMEGAHYTRTRDKFEPSAELGQALMAKHKE